MGTPALAAHVLERLASAAPARFQVVAAVTRPDQPRGRGQTVEPSEVARAAAQLAIETLKPKRINTPEFIGRLRALEPDLLVVVAYGRILPQAILDVPRILPLNVHASLLPRHRGAAPIEAAILAGDAETGVTIMHITAEMDAGPMLLKRAIAIAPDDTQATLKDKLAELGAAVLFDALELVARGEAVETPQDESLATYTRPVKKDDGLIDWTRSATEIERMTRAYDPWPVARTTLNGQPLLIYRAAVDDGAKRGEPPGTLVAVTPDPLVQCGEGRLRLIEVQAPGRKRTSGAAFARGRRLTAGTKLSG
jgi:methionyl-tRNA formyltransferase